MNAGPGRTRATTVRSLGGAAAASWLVALGICAVWVGGQVLGLLVLLRAAGAAMPAELYELWVATAAALAVGWVLASAGTVRPRTALTCVRRATPATWAAVLSGAAATSVLVPVIVRATGSSGRTAAAGAVLGQLLLVLGFAVWTRGRDRPALPALSPRTTANLLVVPFLLTSAVIMAGRLPDVYPLSRFPMYSGTRPDPYTETRVRFFGVDESGAPRELPLPASKNVLRRLARDGQIADLHLLAEDVRAKRSLAGVRVVEEVLQVAPYPAPPQVVIASEQELVSLHERGQGGAGGS